MPSWPIGGGGTAWGPRYMVPLSWILTIPVAELWSRGKKWCLSIAAVAMFSTALQFVAATVHWGVYYGALFAGYPDPENGILLSPGNWWLSPVVGQFLTWQVSNFDLLWGRGGQMAWPIFFGLLALLATSLAFLAYSRTPHSRLNSGLAQGVVAILFIFGPSFFLKEAYRVTRGYPDTDPPTQQVLARKINSFAGKHLVISISEDFSHDFFLNFLKGSFDHYWFSRYQDTKEEILGPAVAEADRIFLVVDRISHPTRIQHWLDGHAVLYHQEWVGSYFLMVYLLPDSTQSPR